MTFKLLSILTFVAFFQLNVVSAEELLCSKVLSLDINQRNRSQLMTVYKERVFRDINQNKEWIKAHQESREGLYFESTVSELKNLNDNIIKNNDLVTSLVNLRKEMEIEAITRFHESLGGEFGDIILYSDFKLIRYFIPIRNRELQQKYSVILKRIYADVDKKFKEKLLSEGLVRVSDIEENWFELGLAESSDLAAVAARKAKDLGVLSLDTLFDSVKSLLAKDLAEAKGLHAELSQNWVYAHLFDDGGGVINLKTIELYRKNRSPESFAKAITDYFNYELSVGTAAKFIQMFQLIDLFSPSLIIEERINTSVSNIAHGVISLDFIGLGAKNLQATSIGVLSSNSIDEVLIRVRENEKEITKAFKSQQQLVRDVMKSFFGLENDLSISFSGDEGVIILPREINLKDMIDIQKILLSAFGTSQLRITYMRADENGDIDADVVSVAESIEKALQVALSKKLDPKLLNQTQFSIWVHPELRPGQRRKVELILYSSVEHSENQRGFIRRAFPQVVRAVDKESSRIHVFAGSNIHGLTLNQD